MCISTYGTSMALVTYLWMEFILDAVVHRVRLTTIEITCDNYIWHKAFVITYYCWNLQGVLLLASKPPVRNAEDQSTPLMSLTWNTDRPAEEFVKRKPKKSSIVQLETKTLSIARTHIHRIGPWPCLSQELDLTVSPYLIDSDRPAILTLQGTAKYPWTPFY